MNSAPRSTPQHNLAGRIAPQQPKIRRRNDQNHQTRQSTGCGRLLPNELEARTRGRTERHNHEREWIDTRLCETAASGA